MNEVKITKNGNEWIEVVSAKIKESKDECCLVGEVKNISSGQLDFIGVVVAIKDKDGQVIDCASEYIFGNSYLQTGETGYFKHYISVATDDFGGGTVVVTPFYQKQE